MQFTIQSRLQARCHRRAASQSRQRTMPVVLFTLPLLAALGGLLAADPAGAQEPQQRQESIRFDIPAGSLESALVKFSNVSGMTVSFTPDMVSGLESSGLRGGYTPAEGLNRLLAGSGLTARFTGAGMVTLAQVGAKNDKPIQLSPIAVTATLVGTRVGETAQESSASVKVFTAGDIEARPGTQEVRDLYGKTPNVVDFGEGNFAPAIRGVDSTGAASGGLGFIAGTRPRATLTVDGRPLSAFELVGGPTGLWDVRQVEVYRGPQTTLQGRNSIAGAFVAKTNDPTFFRETRFQAMAGTEDRHRLSAMASGPLGDDVAFRVAVDHLDARSFVDFTGPQAVGDVEEDESLTARAKLLVAPEARPDFSAQLTIAHNDTRRPQSQLSARPFDERERQVSQTAFEIRSTDVILDLKYQLSDRLALSNTTTYSDIEFDRLDAPANGQFELEGPQMTNETLLNLDDPERGLKGVLGLYLFHEDRDDAGFIGTPFVFGFDDETLTTSVFGELEWALTEELRATVGARYEREERKRKGSAFGIVTDLDETFDAFLPKAGLAWDVSNTLTLGAEASRGFNAGGGSVSFGASDAAGNPSPDPALGPRSFVFDSEYVWNYELFVRTRLLDDRMFLTANVFYSDFDDQQRVEQLDFPGGFTDTIIVNTEETEAYGAELGIEYSPSGRVDLFLDFGLLNTSIEKTGDPRIKGNDFARAPSFTSSFGATWRPTPAWQLDLDGRYVGEYFSTDLNNSRAEVDEYFIANAGVAWHAHSHLRLFGSVTNLFDSDAERRLFAFPATAAPSLANVVEPRVFWFGVDLSY